MRLINHDTVVFHRVGGLHLTTRFKDDGLPIISENDWVVDSQPVEITFTNGTSLQLTTPVREFIPRYGDVTGRRYTDAHGKHHWMDLPAYGLVDPEGYSQLIRALIPRGTMSWAAAQGRSHQEAIRLIKNGAVCLTSDFFSSYFAGQVCINLEKGI